MEQNYRINWWTVRIALLLTCLIALNEGSGVNASPVNTLGGFDDGIIISIFLLLKKKKDFLYF